MGVDICGFLEISSLEEADLEDKYAWMSCIDLISLNLPTGDICSILFGESSPNNDTNEWLPIAKRRGPPNNSAWLTAQAIEESRSNDSTIMSTWGYTFITHEEIERIDWQTYPGAKLELNKTYGWGLLFSLMKVLDDASKHQRLIVWFEWR